VISSSAVEVAIPLVGKPDIVSGVVVNSPLVPMTGRKVVAQMVAEIALHSPNI